MRTIAVSLLLCLGWIAPALSHNGEAHLHAAPWTFDPWIIIPMVTVLVLYASGLGRLWLRVGFGRGIRTWQAVLYSAGWLSLAAALCTPLHWLGEHVFTFHMIEHEIIMAVAAPLIAVSRPLGAYVWAFPRAARRRFHHLTGYRPFKKGWSWVASAEAATLIHGLAIWAWHAPPVFDAAIKTEWVHRLQHLSFLGSALLFWWALCRTKRYGAAAGHLFLTMIHTGGLGALMTLAPRVLYGVQTADAINWGLTPLEDQQLAGVVMWIPAGTVYAAAALIFVALWITGAKATAYKIPAFERP